MSIVFICALCYCIAELLSWRARPSFVHRTPSVKHVFSETVKRINAKFYPKVSMGENIWNCISFESTQQIPQNPCILLKSVSTKVVQRIVQFQNLHSFFFSFFKWHLKVSNDISSESKHEIYSPPKNHVYSYGGSLPKLLKELWSLKVWISDNFVVVVLFGDI